MVSSRSAVKNVVAAFQGNTDTEVEVPLYSFKSVKLGAIVHNYLISYTSWFIRTKVMINNVIVFD